MNLNEFRLALHGLPFLDAHAHTPSGTLELRSQPNRKLLAWHPEAIDWIFRADQRMSNPGSRSLTPLFGEQSLLWSDGPRHNAYRKVLVPPMRGRRLAEFKELITSTVHAAIDDLTPGTVVRLPDWTRDLTLRIIGQMLLGRTEHRLLTPITDWLERAFGSPRRTLAYRYLRGGLPKPDEDVVQTLVRIAKGNARHEPGTLSALMLAEDGPLGGIDDKELRDQIVSLLFSGHETTASATAWTLFWLDRHEQLRHDVISELNATSDDGWDPAQTPLLQAVIQEALRLTPSVPAAGNRQLHEDAELLGHRLAKGTILAPSIYLAHRQPDYFPSPNRFDPHRFLDKRTQPQRYLPFGGGIRHCPGSQFAQLEIRTITAAVLRRREWQAVNPSAGVPQLRGHAMAPAAKLRMRVTRCPA